MKRMRCGSMLAISLMITFAMAAGCAHVEAPDKVSAQAKPDSLGIQNGSTVQLEYRLSDDKGKVLDTNEGGDPLVYTHGQGQIIPGLEKALSGLRVGDIKHVVVSPDEAYGPIRPDAFVEVPKERVPEKSRIVGAHLVAQGQDGQTRHAFVKEIKEKTILLDTNHPLAGKILTFDVRVVGVDPAKNQ